MKQLILFLTDNNESYNRKNYHNNLPDPNYFNKYIQPFCYNTVYIIWSFKPVKFVYYNKFTFILSILLLYIAEQS